MRRPLWVLWGFAILIIGGFAAAPPSAGETAPVPMDANPPAGTILSPIPDGWQGNPWIYLEVRWTDPDGIMVSSFAMSVDGIPLVMSWNGILLRAVAEGLADGPHTAEARASDQLGNGPTVLMWSFFLDTVRPVVDITSPIGNPLLASGSVVLTWTGTDVDSGIDRYQVRIDDGASIDVGDGTSFPFPELAPGIHYFQVWAYDVAGNYGFASTVATVPASPPPPPPSGNTTVRVSLSGDMPSWAIVLIVITVVELVAIVVFALRRRESSAGRPNE